MKNHVLSSLVSVLFFGFATAAWADVTEISRTLTADEEVMVNGALTVPEGVTIDVSGYKLVYKGVTAIAGKGTITGGDSFKTGCLEFNITKDSTLDSLALSGNLQLLKSGSKQLGLSKTTQTYTGGTVVDEGTLKLTLSAQTFAASNTNKPLGAKGSTVKINSNGTLDVNGKYNFKDVYAITLNGGTLANTGKRANIGSYPFNAAITLEDNSTFKTSDEFNYAGELNLHNYTLTLTLSNILHWGPSAVDAGTIVLGGTKNLQLEKNVDLSDVSFQVGGFLNLQSYTLKVKDYVANDATYSGTGALQVLGVFTPASDTFYPPTMMNGSTIDLSGKTETWNGSAVTFADGAAVTIALGDRVLEANQKIVSWDAKPEGVTFGFTGTGIEETEFSVTEVGIVYRAVSEGIAVATWIGGESDDWGAATNWDCRNARGERLADAVPDETMTVVVTGDVSALKLSSDFPFAGVRFLNAYLSTSPDWSGFDFGRVTEDSLLDTKGVALELTTWGTSSVTPLTITNTSETEGLLTVNVPEGVLFTNDTLSVSGNLKFVKTGLGTLVAERYPQTYAGETVVEEGVLRAADNSNVNATEKGSPFGALRTITVSAAGVLDPRGSYAWSYHTINLAGGMISNTVARYGVSSDQYNAASRRDPFNPTISLLDDSILATPVNHNFSGKLKTNGHTLTAWIKSGCSLRWIPDSAPFASVVVTGGGWFYTLKNFTMNEKTFDLTMVNGYFHLGGSLTVSNYLAQAKGNTFDYENNASPTMKVYGTFTPESEHFVGCTMQNGSTIDLSGKTGPWKSQGFAWGKGDVDFAAGATVTVDVHGRSFTRRTQIVKWTQTSAASAAGANFVLDAASKATGLKLASVPYDEANPDVGGLYVERRGLVLLFQ